MEQHITLTGQLNLGAYVTIYKDGDKFHFVEGKEKKTNVKLFYVLFNKISVHHWLPAKNKLACNLFGLVVPFTEYKPQDL